MRLHIIGRQPFGACFSDTDQPSTFILGLLFGTLDDIRAALEWLGAGAAMLQLDACFARQWSHGSAEFDVAPAKYAALRRRAQGWPWNRYELQQMWNAGHYPPERLSPRMERWFLKNRHAGRS